MNDCAEQPPSLQFPTVIPLGHAPTTNRELPGRLSHLVD